MNNAIERWRQRARSLRKETYALYLAARDPRVPWYAKLIAVCVVGYAFSPIDLIPDFIPVLGYVDDLVLVPLGIALVLKMIPGEVMADCRERGLRPLSPRGNRRIGSPRVSSSPYGSCWRSCRLCSSCKFFGIVTAVEASD
jgi:uncharacterized membrane protein YkvA (DUF1232 family)